MSCISVQYEVIKELTNQGLTVFTAESCTGGLICKLLTDVNGASAVLKGGVVCYVNEIKKDVLGVKSKTIEKYTEVSKECASEMAECARKLGNSDIGLSVTGYANGGAGVPQDMAGVVFFGISDKNGTCVMKIKFEGNRDSVRQQAAKAILEALLLRLKGRKD